MNQKAKLGVVIVSYNTSDLTCKAISSLISETVEPFELIVIDNNSSDGSQSQIAALFPAVRLVALDANLGFARANNIAASALPETEFLLLLNPDTEILDGAVDRVVAYAQEDKASAIWGVETLFPDKSLNPTYCWNRQTIASLFLQAIGISSRFRTKKILNPEAPGYWRRKKFPFSPDVISGCFLMMRRVVWDRLHGFDERFFMYGEDADLCLRAQKLGAVCTVVPGCSIIHVGGASERIREDKLVRLIGAKLQLLDLHMPPRRRSLAKALLKAWPLSRYYFYKLKSLLLGSTSIDGTIGNSAKEAAHIWISTYDRIRRL